MRLRNVLIVLLIGAMIVLHQDFWFWTDSRLVLGFLPIGLAYHAVYSVLCAITLAILVRVAWPRHLEDIERHAGGPDHPEAGGH